MMSDFCGYFVDAYLIYTQLRLKLQKLDAHSKTMDGGWFLNTQLLL